jgi:hypothetical protein
MTIDHRLLKCGNCEPLKMSVHASALGLALICGVYNAAAWLSRRERHLAINTVMYTVLALWEQQHVAHHLAAMKPCATAPVEPAATVQAAAAEPEVPVAA